MIEGTMAKPAAEADDEERVPRATGAAMYAFCLVVFIGLFVGPLGTLVIWMRRRDETFVDLHGRQALDLTITGLLGGIILVAGRVVEPDFVTFGRILQWSGFAIVALQGLQGLWGLIDAAMGGAKSMLLSLRILRRGGAWAQPMV